LEYTANILNQWNIPEDSHIALYLPIKKSGKINVLNCIKSIRGDSPKKLSIESINSLTRAAWWGGLRIWEPHESDSQMDFIDGEFLIALVPIGFGRIYGGSAVALLRIGLQTPIPDIEYNMEEQFRTFEPILEHISALVLEKCYNP
jgi:hypothetical protein